MLVRLGKLLDGEEKSKKDDIDIGVHDGSGALYNSISGLSRPLPHPYCSPCYSAAALSGLQVHKITVFATTPASHPLFLQTTAKFTSLKNVILCSSYHICLRSHKSAIKPSIDQLPDPEHEHHSGSILNVRTGVDFRP